MTGGSRHYPYVGPHDVLARVRPGHLGQAIASAEDLAAWMAMHSRNEQQEPFTFVIDLTGVMRLAPRRSEHAACAGGAPVLSAGEITFTRDDRRWTVGEVSNQSTGYCPDLPSWTAVEDALDRAGIEHPGRYTHPIVFRRCPRCRETNIVKDGHFACALCGTALPATWNLDRPAEHSS
ncbi:hypothetical protein ACIBF1_20775 [Spirillospora sp. NPDC050679]